MDDRLYRSTTDRSLAGVCGGLAAWLGLDPSIIRIAWVLLSLMTGGIFVLLYLVMAVVVPEAPPGWTPRGRMQTGPTPRWDQGYGGSSAPGGAWTGTAGWQGGVGAPPPPNATPGGTPGQPPPPTSWPEDWGRAAPPPAASTFRSDRAGIAVGGVLIALGAWFLVKDYIAVNWDLVWPIAVIVLGGLMIAGAMRRRS